MGQDGQEKSPQILDPTEFAQVFTDVLQQSSQLLAQFATRERSLSLPGVGHAEAVGQAFMEWAGKAAANPLTLAQAQGNLWQDYVRLWRASTQKALGQPADTLVEPKKGDKRFAAEAWSDGLLFEYIKQFYLLSARHIHAAMAGVEDLDPAIAKKVDFYTRQYIDAFSPTNFALTNPKVLEETIRTGGMNLLKGLKNLLTDLERGSIRMTDLKAFKLGENLAMTKGQVVYQNDLMQLLQYEPTTEVVYKRPLLIVPPWINKYYILDLRENNSRGCAQGGRARPWVIRQGPPGHGGHRLTGASIIVSDPVFSRTFRNDPIHRPAAEFARHEGERGTHFNRLPGDGNGFFAVH
jgi:polyhydroxyalkanoate synthase